MNKEGFIKQLMEKTNYPQNECIIINDILERYFILGKNSKQKYIEDFMYELDLEDKEAENLYEICMDIIDSNLKDKLKHPFNNNN